MWTVTRVVMYALFAVWLVMTCVVLFTPAETVRETNKSIESATTIKAHEEAPLYMAIHNSKSVHAFCFLGLALLASCLTSYTGLKTYIRVLLILTAASLITELIQQYFIAGRSCEWLDIAMNELGILVGATMALCRRNGETVNR